MSTDAQHMAILLIHYNLVFRLNWNFRIRALLSKDISRHLTNDHVKHSVVEEH